MNSYFIVQNKSLFNNNIIINFLCNMTLCILRHTSTHNIQFIVKIIYQRERETDLIVLQ